LESEVVVLKLF